MALSIKTAEADQLARNLARLTGETMTHAVTVALRERLDRERLRREAENDLPTRLTRLAAGLATAYNTCPVTQDEWNAACGEPD